MAWLYAPASADSNSVCAEYGQTYEQSAGSSETTSLPASSSPGCEKEPWTRLLCGMTSPHSMAQRGVDAWISSLRATRASHSVWPANAEARAMTGTSGRTLPESFATWDRDGSCWRTSQATLPWASPTFSASWPRWGTMRSGAAIRQSKPDVPTGASDCSCWPTATVCGNNNRPGASPKAGTGLGTAATQVVSKLPTPQAHDSTKGKTQAQVQAMRERTGAGVRNLNETAETTWPTPRASIPGSRPNKRGGKVLSEEAKWATPRAGWNQNRMTQVPPSEAAGNNGLSLAGQACDHQGQASQTPGSGSQPTTQTRSLRLNPVFVEWLMGFPRNWSLPFVGTDSAASETQ